MSFILTAENYHSPEANMLYMSNSQYKDFGECEAMALAKARGEYVEEKSEALLVGGYVDAHFSGTLAQYKAQNPEIFRKDGKGLLAAYVRADEIINRIERDPVLLAAMQGQQQVIMTGEINGVQFKIKMDSYFPGVKIVDGKTVASFGAVWQDGAGKVPFVDAWGYDAQGAIYQYVEWQNSASDAKLPFLIAAATKEKVTDIALFVLPEYKLDAAFANVDHFAPRYAAIKRGEIEPNRCEVCDYCKATRALTGPMDYADFLERYGIGGYGE